jgi:hypothetical protein
MSVAISSSAIADGAAYNVAGSLECDGVIGDEIPSMLDAGRPPASERVSPMETHQKHVVFVVFTTRCV